MTTSLTVEQQVLDRALAAPSTQRWQAVAPIETTARSSYFALHRSPAGDPLAAISQEFEQLINSLGVQTRPVRRAYVGRVRGKIDWAATVRARSADQQNPLRFVCSEAERQTNTPENQLVVFVLARLKEALSDLPDIIRDGQCRHSLAADYEADGSLRGQVDSMESQIRILQANPRLRAVTEPAVIEQHHLDAAHRTKRDGYHTAALIYQRWYALVQRPTRAALIECATHSILLPAPDQADSEPWIELAGLLISRRT